MGHVVSSIGKVSQIKHRFARSQKLQVVEHSDDDDEDTAAAANNVHRTADDEDDDKEQLLAMSTFAATPQKEGTLLKLSVSKPNGNKYNRR